MSFENENEKLSGFMSWMTGQCIGQMLDKA